MTIEKLRAAVAQVWDTSKETTISEVLEAHYKLSPETEADPGSYDLDNNPYWRKVLDCCNDPEVKRVTLLKSTQVGGTILTQGILLAAAVVDPAPAMYVCPTRDEIKIQRDRIYANALVSGDPFRNLVPPQRAWNMEVMRLGACNVNLAYVKSPQRLRGKPCKRVILNETDTYQYRGDAGNPHRAARERTKQFFDSLIFEESTPVGDASHIAEQYDKSNRERYEVECPHCGHWQEFRFFPYKTGPYAGFGGVAGYRDDKGNLLDRDEAEKKAYYLCAKGCSIEARYKNAMITRAHERGGGWAPDGCHYENDETGNVILKGTPKRGRAHSGFHVWTMLQSKISIGKIAAEYVSAYQDGRLRDFFQNWLGLRYSVGKRAPKWETVAARYARTYERSIVPSPVWFLTGAADVQEDLVYWLVVGWAPWRTPYVIDWGEIYKQETDDGALLASDLAKLPEVLLTRSFKVDGVNPRGHSVLPVRLAGVDSNYRVSEVHDFVRSVGDENRLRALRGDDSVKGSRYRRAVIQAKQRGGEVYEGGLVQYQIYKTYYQDNLSEKLLADPHSPGALHLPTDILPSGRKLVRQLCNVRKSKEGYYETTDNMLGKDYRDLLGYCEAIADMVVDSTVGGNNKWSEQAMVNALRDETRRSARRKKTRLDRGRK